MLDFLRTDLHLCSLSHKHTWSFLAASLEHEIMPLAFRLVEIFVTLPVRYLLFQAPRCQSSGHMGSKPTGFSPFHLAGTLMTSAPDPRGGAVVSLTATLGTVYMQGKATLHLLTNKKYTVEPRETSIIYSRTS